MNIRDLVRVSALPVVVASLCCLSPVILVLVGLGTASFAASLADTLYGEYVWYFRGAGLLALAVSLIVYLRRTKGVCTIDDVKRRRNEIINIVALSLTVGVLGYLFFLYIVVEYLGVLLGLWQ